MTYDDWKLEAPDEYDPDAEEELIDAIEEEAERKWEREIGQ